LETTENQPLDSKLTSSTECVVGTKDSAKIIDACLLAGLLCRVKQQQQKKKQVIDFALDAMLVKYRYYYYYYYIIHALWLPLQSFRIMFRN
jgi:hypothetical protein